MPPTRNHSPPVRQSRRLSTQSRPDYTESLETPSSDLTATPIPFAATHSATKKRHSRSKPANHIPRPPNAFILYRSDLWAKEVARKQRLDSETTPNTVHQPALQGQRDHRNVSRIAGEKWNELSEEDQAPWRALAEAKKDEHALMFPGWKYAPGGSSSITQKKSPKGRKRGTGKVRPVDSSAKSSAVVNLVLNGFVGEDLSREMQRINSQTSNTDSIILDASAPASASTSSSTSTSTSFVSTTADEDVSLLATPALSLCASSPYQEMEFSYFSSPEIDPVFSSPSPSEHLCKIEAPESPLLESAQPSALNDIFGVHAEISEFPRRMSVEGPGPMMPISSAEEDGASIDFVRSSTNFNFSDFALSYPAPNDDQYGYESYPRFDNSSDTEWPYIDGSVRFSCGSVHSDSSSIPLIQEDFPSPFVRTADIPYLSLSAPPTGFELNEINSARPSVDWSENAGTQSGESRPNILFDDSNDPGVSSPPNFSGTQTYHAADYDNAVFRPIQPNWQHFSAFRGGNFLPDGLAETPLTSGFNFSLTSL